MISALLFYHLKSPGVRHGARISAEPIADWSDPGQLTFLSCPVYVSSVPDVTYTFLLIIYQNKYRLLFSGERHSDKLPRSFYMSPSAFRPCAICGNFRIAHLSIFLYSSSFLYTFDYPCYDVFIHRCVALWYVVHLCAVS